jgi:hypothetical protein
LGTEVGQEVFAKLRGPVPIAEALGRLAYFNAVKATMPSSGVAGLPV